VPAAVTRETERVSLVHQVAARRPRFRSPAATC